MTQQAYTGTQFQPGDVVSYIPKHGHHCRQATAIVHENGCAMDTFWGLDGFSEGHVLSGDELAGAELRFRLGDFRPLGAHYEHKREEWLTYAPADRQRIGSQHQYQSTYFVRVGAEPDLDTQIANAREAVKEAESAVRSAQQRRSSGARKTSRNWRRDMPDREALSDHSASAPECEGCDVVQQCLFTPCRRMTSEGVIAERDRLRAKVEALRGEPAMVDGAELEAARRDPKVKALIGEALQARQDASLKHLQQWKAIGADSGSESDHGHWRYQQHEADGDAHLMRENADPPYDEVYVVTRWLSKPERVELSGPSDEETR